MAIKKLIFEEVEPENECEECGRNVPELYWDLAHEIQICESCFIDYIRETVMPEQRVE